MLLTLSSFQIFRLLRILGYCTLISAWWMVPIMRLCSMSVPSFPGVFCQNIFFSPRAETTGSVIILQILILIIQCCWSLTITFALPNLFARSFIWAIWTVLVKWGRMWACVYTSFRYSSDLAVSNAEKPYQVFFHFLPFSLSRKQLWLGGGGGREVRSDCFI